MWNITDPATVVAVLGAPDEGEKTLRPTVPYGQAPWWADYVWAVRQEFVRRVKVQSPNVTSLAITATALDRSGLGTLTITLTTS